MALDVGAGNKIMRILMISPYLPWPLHAGSSVRIFNILKELSQKGHKIVLLGGQEKDKLLPADNVLYSLCEKIYKYDLPSKKYFYHVFSSLFSPKPYPAQMFATESLREKLNYLLKSQKFDLIWINFLILVDALPYHLIKNNPVILDQHECDELVYRGYLRRGNIGERLFAFLNLIKVKKFEKKNLPKIDAILCVSQPEADFMQNQELKKVKIWAVPNGVSKEFFQPISFQNKANRLLLCSNFGVRRNVDAAIWFAKSIFPRIKEKIPDAAFLIVGRSDTSSKIWQLNLIPDVRVIGTVNDIIEYYQKGKVFVVPYRFGAGTKLKVLEAMAIGIPVVSTTVGCRGIEAVNGEHLLIADNENDFANQIIELLNNPEKRQKLALAARKLVEEKYQWGKIVDGLEPKLQKLIYGR